jgi:hypothetical protein
VLLQGCIVPMSPGIRRWTVPNIAHMGSACHLPTSQRSHSRDDARHHEFVAHQDGWHKIVRKSKHKRKRFSIERVSLRPSASSSRKVPADMVDLCFNCFVEDHVMCRCPNPSCYFRCREPGHQAKDCVCLRCSLSSHQGCSRGNDRPAPPPSACLRRHPPELVPKMWSLSPSSNQAPSPTSYSTKVSDWHHMSDSFDDIFDPALDGLADLQRSY